MDNHASKRIIGKIFLYLVLLVVSVVCILPLFQAISYSLKTSNEMLAYPPTWLPKSAQFINYTAGLSYIQAIYPLGRWFINSVFTSSMIVLGNILSGLMIAYGFARFNGRGKTLWFVLIISTMLIPIYCVIIPLMMMFKALHWTNTYLSMLVQPFFGTATYIFLFRQFIMGIPTEIDEAATIDGASAFKIFYKIIIPLAKPAIFAVGILCFVAAWGDFFTPMIFLSDTHLFTVSVGLAIIQSQVQTMYTNREYIYVITVLVSTPCLLVFFFAQKYFTGGLTLGAVKE